MFFALALQFLFTSNAKEIGDLGLRSGVANMQTLHGNVLAGRGQAREHLTESSREIARIVGSSIFPGSLNVVLDRPVRFSENAARRFDNSHRFLWSAQLNGTPVWICRWAQAPLHVAEIIATTRLRDTLRLADGDDVRLEVSEEAIGHIRPLDELVWKACWQGRRSWCYAHNGYYWFAKAVCLGFGATQGISTKRSFARLAWKGKSVIKKVLKSIPVVGPVLQAAWHAMKKQPQFDFVRQELGDGAEADFQMTQIQNVLNYTKTSGSSYSAQEFPAAYHSIDINGRKLKGQRDPGARFRTVPFDFTGKTVLDLGCNQGGMLFQVRDRVSHGVGVDFDSRMINAANRIKDTVRSTNLSFYVLNLEQENLNLIRDFIAGKRVDVVFLLSVCMWLKNWKDVMRFAADVGEAMLFESNGSAEQQAEQIAFLKELYPYATALTGSSEDDPKKKERRLYFAARTPITAAEAGLPSAAA